jgi:DNA-binding PadR family transcriptional regulator
MKGAEVFGHLTTDVGRRQCYRRLDRLADRGLVEKTRVPTELNRNEYRITSEGQRLLEQRCEEMIDAVGWDVLQPVAEDDLITDGGVFVSEHAADRWDERTPPDSVAPETAWEHSERRTDLRGPSDFAEVRYHRATGVVLGRCGATIVTVLPPQDTTSDPQEVEG